MANQHRQKSNFLKKDMLPLTTKICVNRQINPSDCIAAVPDDAIINEAPTVSVIMKERMQELS